LVKVGQYEEAITYFNKVLQIDENDSIALRYKKLAYHELKKNNQILNKIRVIVNSTSELQISAIRVDK
jgi:tetratricopeptide (TPR) repeat protein